MYTNALHREKLCVHREKLHSFPLCNAFVYMSCFFFRIIRKYLSQEAVNFFIITLVYSAGFIVFPCIMHCIHLSHFFFRIIRFFPIVTLVYSGYIAFPYLMHLYILFSSIIRKYLHHAFCYAQLVSVCLTMMSWSYIIYCIKDSKVEDYLSSCLHR